MSNAQLNHYRTKVSTALPHSSGITRNVAARISTC